jgi:hypothetical protein
MGCSPWAAIPAIAAPNTWCPQDVLPFCEQPVRGLHLKMLACAGTPAYHTHPHGVMRVLAPVNLALHGGFRDKF